MKNLILSCIMFNALIIASTGLNAQVEEGVVWSCNAMTAIPEIKAVQEDLYWLHGGRVLFVEGKTGLVNLFCPITRDLGPLRSLYITYRDGDGNQGPNEVKAVLRRVNRETGSVTSFDFGEVSSNDLGDASRNFNPAPNSGPSGWATHQSAHEGETLLNQNHQMDLSKYYYYVQITMKKTQETPLAVMGVFLHK